MAVKNQSESLLRGDVDALPVLTWGPVCTDGLLLESLSDVAVLGRTSADVALLLGAMSEASPVDDMLVLSPLESARSFAERLSSLLALPPPAAATDALLEEESASTMPLAVSRSIRVCRGERKLAGSNGIANVTNDAICRATRDGRDERTKEKTESAIFVAAIHSAAAATGLTTSFRLV